MNLRAADRRITRDADARHSRRIRATCCGGLASRFLGVQRSGHVAAVLGSSFYLGAPEGVVCVGDQRIDAGALNVVTDAARDTDWAALGMRSGRPWRAQAGCIHIGGVLRVELADAMIWRPRACSESWSRDRTARALSTLLDMARTRMSADGLGGIVLARGEPPSRPPLLVMAWTPVAALRIWLAAAMRSSGAPAAAVPNDVRRLVGLGPGLTPSGDDLLGGVLIALHALDHDDARRRLWHAVRPRARASGNAISLAHLAAAADGYSCAAVHTLLGALRSADRVALAASLDRTARYGHTSGWDTLAGIVTVLGTWVSG